MEAAQLSSCNVSMEHLVIAGRHKLAVSVQRWSFVSDVSGLLDFSSAVHCLLVDDSDLMLTFAVLLQQLQPSMLPACCSTASNH